MLTRSFGARNGSTLVVTREQKYCPLSGGENDLSILPDVQTGSGLQPAYHSMSTGGSFVGGKVYGTYICTLTDIQIRVIPI